MIFRLGRLINQKGPGLILLIPFIDRMVKIDLRTVTLNIPPQEVITRDNVPTSVNAVVTSRVVDPNRAITDVENYLIATSQIAQTSLRAVLGKAELDEILSRASASKSLQKIIDEQTEALGREGHDGRDQGRRDPRGDTTGDGPAGRGRTGTAGQDHQLRRRKARRRRKLTDAADIISHNPASLQLRYLQTLLEISGNQNSTVIFPLPMDLISAFQQTLSNIGNADAGSDGGVQPTIGGASPDELSSEP